MGHSGGNDRHLVGTDRDPVPTCKECCCVVLDLVSRVWNRSFDSLTETDIVARSSHSDAEALNI